MMKKWIITTLILSIFLCVSASASTWYVRPKTGEYGAENGEAYATAWDGLGAIVWGGGGVVAGDTLYVAGTFNRTDEGLVNMIVPTVDGSSGNRITVRGDYGGDPGNIISAKKKTSGSFTDNADGSFWVAFPFQTLAVVEGDPTGTSYILEPVADQAACAATNASFWYDDPGNILWVNPTGSILDVWANWTTAIDNDGRDYMTYLNLNMYCGNQPIQVDKDGDASAATNVTIDGCLMKYIFYIGIESELQADDLTIKNCNFSEFKAGIYIQTGTDGPENLTITDNTLDGGILSTKNYWTGSDAGAMQLQPGDNGIIEHNTITNTAQNGIVIWIGATRDCLNLSIKYNWIEGIFDDDAEVNIGIVVGGLNGVDYGNHYAGMVIAYNVIINCNGDGNGDDFAGSAFNIKVGDPDLDADRINVFNNVAYDCDVSFYYRRCPDDNGMGFVQKNNISLSPKTGGHHVFIENMTGTNCDIDNNCYYPDTAGIDNLFVWDGALQADFAGWQTASSKDGNAVLDDPLFVDAGGDDYHLLIGSPCINNGVNVGLTEDYDGYSVSDPPEMGAFEYPLSPLVLIIILFQ